MQTYEWQDLHDGFVKLTEIEERIARATGKGSYTPIATLPTLSSFQFRWGLGVSCQLLRQQSWNSERDQMNT